MTGRILAVAFVLALAALMVPGAPAAGASYTPKPGDQFAYNETVVVGNGTGLDYFGYTESTLTNGSLTVASVLPNGTESAAFYNANSYENSTGGHFRWVSSGRFTFSARTFRYVNGTDNQTGYVDPYVWFFMNDSLAAGAAFYLLNTGMTVVATSYNYALETAAGTYVKAIFSEGNGSYERDDSYGVFDASYNWKAYFDPTTGYILGYVYTERDVNDSTGNAFTLTDTLAVTHTSYALTPGLGPPGAPTRLAATVVNAAEIDLTWTNPAGPLSDNHVYEFGGSACAGSPTSFDLGGVHASYAVSGLAAATAYSFEVTASNNSGEGARSACVSATTAASPPSSSGSGGLGSDWVVVGILLVVIIVGVLVALAVSRSRRRASLPRHSATGQASYAAPPVGPPPPGVRLTPSDQPAVQQIIIKETVKVKCQYCGALIDSTATTCPFCGAART